MTDHLGADNRLRAILSSYRSTRYRPEATQRSISAFPSRRHARQNSTESSREAYALLDGNGS
jgi:hypothetical protein